FQRALRNPVAATLSGGSPDDTGESPVLPGQDSFNKSIETRATSSSPTTNLPRLLSSRANPPVPAPGAVLRRSAAAPGRADTIRQSNHGLVWASAQPLLVRRVSVIPPVCDRWSSPALARLSLPTREW